MVLFVDLEEDGPEQPQIRDGKLVWHDGTPYRPLGDDVAGSSRPAGAAGLAVDGEMEAREPPVSEVPTTRTPMAEAFRCYP